jgi:hypothetical protein
MKTKRWLVCFMLMAAAAGLGVFPTRVAHADVGPKPSMTFQFKYDVSPALTIVSGTLLECSDPHCTDAAPLKNLGPQGMHCGEAGCSSLAYGYSKYHRLSIEFSDGQTRESNIFRKNHYQARYTVHVLEKSLEVRETGGTSTVGVFGWMAMSILLQQYLNPGLFVTILIELVSGVIYVLWRKRSWLRVLLTILLMNMLTQPILWLVVKSMGLSMCAGTYALELGVCLLEAWILYLVLRKSVKFSETLLLSLVMNLASFGTGLLLPF